MKIDDRMIDSMVDLAAAFKGNEPKADLLKKATGNGSILHNSMSVGQKIKRSFYRLVTKDELERQQYDLAVGLKNLSRYIASHKVLSISTLEAQSTFISKFHGNAGDFKNALTKCVNGIVNAAFTKKPETGEEKLKVEQLTSLAFDFGVSLKDKDFTSQLIKDSESSFQDLVDTYQDKGFDAIATPAEAISKAWNTSYKSLQDAYKASSKKWRSAKSQLQAEQRYLTAKMALEINLNRSVAKILDKFTEYVAIKCNRCKPEDISAGAQKLAELFKSNLAISETGVKSSIEELVEGAIQRAAIGAQLPSLEMQMGRILDLLTDDQIKDDTVVKDMVDNILPAVLPEIQKALLEVEGRDLELYQKMKGIKQAFDRQVDKCRARYEEITKKAPSLFTRVAGLAGYIPGFIAGVVGAMRGGYSLPGAALYTIGSFSVSVISQQLTGYLAGKIAGDKKRAEFITQILSPWVAIGAGIAYSCVVDQATKFLSGETKVSESKDAKGAGKVGAHPTQIDKSSYPARFKKGDYVEVTDKVLKEDVYYKKHFPEARFFMDRHGKISSNIGKDGYLWGTNPADNEVVPREGAYRIPPGARDVTDFSLRFDKSERVFEGRSGELYYVGKDEPETKKWYSEHGGSDPHIEADKAFVPGYGPGVPLEERNPAYAANIRLDNPELGSTLSVEQGAGVPVNPTIARPALYMPRQIKIDEDWWQ